MAGLGDDVVEAGVAAGGVAAAGGAGLVVTLLGGTGEGAAVLEIGVVGAEGGGEDEGVQVEEDGDETVEMDDELERVEVEDVEVADGVVEAVEAEEEDWDAVLLALAADEGEETAGLGDVVEEEGAGAEDWTVETGVGSGV